MKPIFRTKRLLALLAAGCFGMMSADAATVIYEPFSQAAGDLAGKTGGIGLSGNWTASANTVDIVNPPTLAYGNLQNTGGQVNIPSAAGNWGAIQTTTDLANAGLLVEGATLWFSYVYQKTLNGGTNEHSGFAFGTERVSPGASGLLLANSGFGFGVHSNSSSVTASSWLTGARTGGTGSALQALNSPTLVIGKIVWGADAGATETITVYTRALNNIATEPTTGGGVRTTAAFDQTQLDTISFGHRNSGGTQFYDEIRFGASYADVAAAVPEPSAALLGGLGCSPFSAVVAEAITTMAVAAEAG